VATTKSEDKKCTRCGSIKKLNATNFYKSYSELFKNNGDSRMCICKDCVIELAEQFKTRFNSDTRGLYEMCKLLDVYYIKSLYESAIEQASKNNKKDSNPYSIYFQKVNSLPQYAKKTFIDSEPFNKVLDNEEIAEDIGRDIVDFWGDGLSQRDYDFLEREFKNLTSRYECDSYAQELLFKEIAFQTLDIRNKRKEGKDVSKEVKTLQDLLGSANIKPAQENASMASEQVTFGTLIKKYENEQPVPEPLPEWMTADWIRKYVVVWFFGNLCRMMGKVNPFQDEYEKEMDNYTVKVDVDEYEESGE
jgi:hypothetical protein